MTILRVQFFWLFFLTCCMGGLVHAATPAPRASVDRTIVTEGDSLTLTIRIDDTGSYDAPDLSTLQKDFEIYDSNQSSQHVINNGRIESHTEWQTTLIPKHSGQLQIPPIAVAGSQTQPITLQVNPASKTNSVDTSEPVFLEVKVDHDNVYVQQQIVLTARVYIAVQLDNLQLTKPDFDNASVQQLGETKFERSINGIPYEVHELTYAIFPQQAGELTIPEMVFSGVEVVGGRSLFDFPGRGRPIRKMSKQIAIHVKPIPKNFTGSVWLPARNLTLSESWSGDQRHLSAGDSITRTVAINADGLLAAQLPTLDQPQIDAAKIYAEQPKLENKSDSAGVHGKRIENSALIPTRAGTLQLPETQIVWWDIDSDSEKIAKLPAENLTITAGTNNYLTPAADQNQKQETAAPAKAETSAQASNTPISLEQNSANIGWKIATALLALLWLITLLALFRIRHGKQHIKIAPIVSADNNEQTLWNNFSNACRNNNPAAARHALLQWTLHYYRAEAISTLEQLVKYADIAQLSREIIILDNRLFGTLRDSNEWNGENLLQVVQSLRKRKNSKHDSTSVELPPLYPTA